MYIYIYTHICTYIGRDIRYLSNLGPFEYQYYQVSGRQRYLNSLGDLTLLIYACYTYLFRECDYVFPVFGAIQKNMFQRDIKASQIVIAKLWGNDYVGSTATCHSCHFCSWMYWLKQPIKDQSIKAYVKIILRFMSHDWSGVPVIFSILRTSSDTPQAHKHRIWRHQRIYGCDVKKSI